VRQVAYALTHLHAMLNFANQLDHQAMDRIAVRALSSGDTQVANCCSGHSSQHLTIDYVCLKFQHASPPIHVRNCVKGESSMLYELRTAKAKGIDHFVPE